MLYAVLQSGNRVSICRTVLYNEVGSELVSTYRFVLYIYVYLAILLWRCAQLYLNRVVFKNPRYILLLSEENASSVQGNKKLKLNIFT